MPEVPLTVEVAQRLLQDPSTSAGDIAAIAGQFPDLHVQIAQHPAAYEQLLDWLVGLGSPEVVEAVTRRRIMENPAPPPPPPPAPPAPTSEPSVPVAPAAPAAPVPISSVPPVSGAPSSGQVPPSTAQVPPSTPFANQDPSLASPSKAGLMSAKKRPLIIGLAAGVLAVALVVMGISTQAFGLLGTGGARTPEAEAIRVLEKAESLVNSFSAKNLLSNPIQAISSITKEIAPSEAALTSSAVEFDLIEALGITKDTIGWIADLAGSFTVDVKDLGTYTAYLADDIAYVYFNQGTVSVTADTTKLRETLNKTAGIITDQVAASTKAYGINTSFSGGQNLGQDFLDDWFYSNGNWVDDKIDDVNDSFPTTINLSDGWDTIQSCIQEKYARFKQQRYDDCYTEYHNIGVVVVKEKGKWYLSSILTPVSHDQRWHNYAFLHASKDWIRINWDSLMLKRDYSSFDDWWNTFGLDSRFDDWWHAIGLNPEWFSRQNITPAEHKTTVEAANAMSQALERGEMRAILRELPLAERRWLATTYTYNDGYDSEQLFAGYSFQSSMGRSPQFSEISKKGDRATIRIDDLRVTQGYDGWDLITVTNGTCVSIEGSQMTCLKEALDSMAMDQIDYAINPRDEEWYSLGIDPYLLLDKLETALHTTANSITPDKMGLVAIREDGSWHVSAVATISDIEGQLVSALSKGLKSIR